MGAVLREQNALPTNKQIKQEKYAAKAAIDNCRAGRAAKSENPSTPAKDTAHQNGVLCLLLYE